MLYDYECPACERVFEARMSLSEYEKNRDKVNCPKCGQLSKRIVSRTPFELKGNGWADQGYAITEMEMRGNRETDRRAEDSSKKIN